MSLPPPSTASSVALQYDVNPSEIICSSISFLYAFPALYTVYRLGVRLIHGGLHGSFQKLVFIFGMSDLFAYATQMLAIRVPYWGTVTVYENFQEGFVPTFLYFLCFSTGYVQSNGCVFMALNRAFSMAFPLSYEKIWNKYVWWLVLIVPVAMQYLTYSILINGAKFRKVGPAVYIIGSAGKDYSYYGIQTCYVFAICCSLALVLNVYTGVILYRYNQNRKEQVKWNEIKFFYICVVTFVCQVLFTLKQWLVSILPSDHPVKLFLFTIGPTLFDFNCFFPIYSILFVSEDFRVLVFPWMGEKRRNTISVQSMIGK